MKSYRDIGILVYGDKCEFDGCGWNAAPCDVHHINYQEQQKFEKELKKHLMYNSTDRFAQVLAEAVSKGFLSYDTKTGQLSKDDRSINLAVLCPNHHRYVHHVDLGMDILKHIPPRK